MFLATLRTFDLALFVFRKGKNKFKGLLAVVAEKFITRHRHLHRHTIELAGVEGCELRHRPERPIFERRQGLIDDPEGVLSDPLDKTRTNYSRKNVAISIWLMTSAGDLGITTKTETDLAKIIRPTEFHCVLCDICCNGRISSP